MKFAVFILFILIAGQTNSQGHNPITSCTMKAMGCWMAQDVNVQQADANLDLVAGCKLFKTFGDCIAGVIKNVTCFKDHTVAQINYQILAQRFGVCLADGTLDVCGRAVQTCFNDVLDIQQAFAKHNATATCPVMTKFRECKDEAENNPSCDDNLKYMLDKIDAQLSQSTLFYGCDGNCGRQVAICLGNLTDININGDFMNTDWINYCSEAYAAIGCVMGLKQQSACSNDTFVEQVTSSQSALVQDYCIGDGKPAPCLEEIRHCAIVWKDESKNKTVAIKCQAASNYITCTSKVSCAAEMKDLLFSLRSEIETQETSDNCPLVGTCQERIATCADMKTEIDRAKKNIKGNNYCMTVKTASACFSYVRNDDWCTQDNITRTVFENSMPKLLDSACSGAGLSISLTMLLLAIVLQFSATRSL